MTELARLAAQVGLKIDWKDAAGEAKTVADAALMRILAALGYPANDAAAIEASLQRLASEDQAIRFVSGDVGQPIAMPAGLAGSHATIELESGGRIERPISLDDMLAPIETIGYHRLQAAGRELVLAIAPERCFGVEDVAPGHRLWGPAIQVPSLRGETLAPFGDFAALAQAAHLFAERGADVMAISPVHALFPADLTRYSPYGPSSRQFLNIALASPRDREPSKSNPNTELIDWHAAIPLRIASLRASFEARDKSSDAAFQHWRSEQGERLEGHALFDALHAHFAATNPGGWQGWPMGYHDRHSSAVVQFARDDAETISFYAFAQWRATQGLAEAQQAAREGGMKLGLIADLAVGIDPGGSQAWSSGEDLLHGLSIGAPPDLLGPDGQDWGLTSFSPRGLQHGAFAGFIAMVRAALAHAGGVRIDHILGLNRLWVIPHGSPSRDGAYLRYPLVDLLRILAIESHRARAVVIGEDLGTVPEDLRPRLRGRGISGMRVLWFERDGEGAYIHPAVWEEEAVALTGTHDVFTIAGWWTGRDIDWNRRLGRHRADLPEAQERAARDADRARLWQALCASGSADGACPAANEPGPVVDAATRHVAITPCRIAIIPLEDIAGLLEQPNLPGTIDEHPNWRRRMPSTTRAFLDQPEISARLAAIDEARS